MDVKNWLDRISNFITEDFASAEKQILQEFETELGWQLPTPLFELLRITDGLLLYHGYYRILSHSSQNILGLRTWNDPDYWRFAWQGKVDRFFSFAETAWGDQFSLSFEDLRSSKNAPIHKLDAIDMTSEIFADNIEDFFELILDDIYNFSQNLTISCIKRDGDIASNHHLIFSPSLLLGAQARIENVTRMPARAAMIINGDLYSQLESVEDDTEVKRLEDYVDEKGRTRLRVVF